MAQVIEIGKTKSFYRYSSLGKAVLEGKVIGTNGDMVEFELPKNRYKNLPKRVVTSRHNIIEDGQTKESQKS